MALISLHAIDFKSYYYYQKLDFLIIIWIRREIQDFLISHLFYIVRHFHQFPLDSFMELKNVPI